MSRQLVLSLAMKTWGRNEKGGIYMLRTYLKGQVLKGHHIDDRVFDIECSIDLGRFKDSRKRSQRDEIF